MQDVGRFVDLTIDFATLFNIDNFIRWPTYRSKYGRNLVSLCVYLNFRCHTIGLQIAAKISIESKKQEDFERNMSGTKRLKSYITR